MIGPKVPKMTKAEEKAAYDLATLRDSDTCQRCRRVGLVVHRDHRQNRQRGNTVVSNLQLLCVECHAWKSGHPAEAFMEGWMVPRHADPAGWPARRWVRNVFGLVPAWVLYDDDGYWVEITDREAQQRMGLEVPF